MACFAVGKIRWPPLRLTGFLNANCWLQYNGPEQIASTERDLSHFSHPFIRPSSVSIFMNGKFYTTAPSGIIPEEIVQYPVEYLCLFVTFFLYLSCNKDFERSGWIWDCKCFGTDADPVSVPIPSVCTCVCYQNWRNACLLGGCGWYASAIDGF